VISVAVVIDALGESWKVWQMLAKKYPALVVIDCYSHQLSCCSIHLTLIMDGFCTD